MVITPADADDATDDHEVNLELGENTISVIVASSDGTTITTYTVTVIRAYGGASLTELELSGVTLSPAFSADVTSYAGSVADDDESTTVTAKAVAGATAVPDGVLTDAGADGRSQWRATNTIDGGGDVLGWDGENDLLGLGVPVSTQTANLTALSLGDDVALSPAFAASTTSYTANVDYSTMQVTVAGTPVDERQRGRARRGRHGH